MREFQKLSGRYFNELDKNSRLFENRVSAIDTAERPLSFDFQPSWLNAVTREPVTDEVDIRSFDGDFREGGRLSAGIVEVPAELAVSQTPLDALNWVNANNIVPNQNGKLFVYFGDSDQNFGQTGDNGQPMQTIDWNNFEKQQVMLALEEFEKVLGIEYQITNDESKATFRLLKTESQNYGAYFIPQDPAYGESQGVGVFNVLGAWEFDQQQALEKGGYSFAVILHEFGHAHGMAHPHDTGGGSQVMRGVTSATGTLGDYSLNQGVYTVMSYNDAWKLHPDGPTPFAGDSIDSGWSGTLAAFDIAVLQDRYNVDLPTETGNTKYYLSNAQVQGTYYQTIIDTAGNDTIIYDGNRDAYIDLRPATLDYSGTGGGLISFVDSIKGGYTIANGVIIEKGIGGRGNDTIVGNDQENILRGNNGDDVLLGGDGRDVIVGGHGFDFVSYELSDGPINARMNDGKVTDADGSRDVITGIEGVIGSFFNDRIIGSNQNDAVNGYGGNDRMILINGDDNAYGHVGNDTIKGGGGADYLAGGPGKDKLVGGRDDDVFAFSDIEKGDIIVDFESGSDVIDLTPTGYFFHFVGSSAFTNSAGELRYANGKLQGDVNGDGIADLIIKIGGDEVVAADLVI